MSYLLTICQLWLIRYKADRVPGGLEGEQPMEISPGQHDMIRLNGAILIGVTIPHSIEDLLYGLPSEFGLTNVQMQIFSGLFSVQLIWIFTQVVGRRRSGVFAVSLLGILPVLVGTLKHLPLMLDPVQY